MLRNKKNGGIRGKLEDNNEDAFESSEEKEIKGLLEGLQKTLLIMQTENRKTAAELTELKSSLQQVLLAPCRQRKKGAER